MVINGETPMVKIGEKYMGMDGRVDFEICSPGPILFLRPKHAKIIILSPNAFAGLYQPYGTLECGSEYHFGEDPANPLTESTLKNNWSYEEDCPSPEGET